MISITVASKSGHNRQILTELLVKQHDFKLTSVGEDGFHALRSAMTDHPDVIIMDFSMDDIDSPDLAPIIKRNSPSTALIVLYSPNEGDAVGKAIRAGISGCLPKQGGFNDLASSIRSVFYGGLYINEAVRNHVMHYFSVHAFSLPLYPPIFRCAFTVTELRIFEGIIHGRTDKEIAKDLNMSVGSLRNCVYKIKRKTGLKNRTQIAVYALYAGLLNADIVREQFLEKPVENKPA